MSLLKLTVVVATILLMVGCTTNVRERTKVCFGWCLESEIEAVTESCKPKIERKKKIALGIAAENGCSDLKNLSKSR